MKLHLGCGRKKWDGYINIDLQDSDADCDIRFLPYENDSVDEIVAIHVVEHFLITEVQAVISEWHRVLKTGGKLVIELPCWDKVIQHIKNDSPENMTRWALYGEPRTHVDGFPALHKWCYSKREMMNLLLAVGFVNASDETPKYHQPSRDQRWVATK